MNKLNLKPESKKIPTLNEMVEATLKNMLIHVSHLIIIREKAMDNGDSEETIKNILSFLICTYFDLDIQPLGCYLNNIDYPEKEDVKLEISDIHILVQEIKDYYSFNNQ